MKNKYKVAIVGCGLIGRKRAMALCERSTLVANCDLDCNTSNNFSDSFGCSSFTDYKELLNSLECDVVVISVVNKYIKDIVIDSLKNKKHVLCEKPLGRNAQEAKEIVRVSKEVGRVLKVGFNHRFHPAIWKAKKIFDDGVIGKCINIRARYGHGGRPGMEKEWRASKELCGGGELLDQGVHIIDLIRWFGGEIEQVYGEVYTKFWEMEVEDNAFAILNTERGVTASFHVSWTNWKNIFSFEVFGTEGYLRIEGLGGNYGIETLEVGIRKKEGGAPHIEHFEFPGDDISWKEEWKEFLSAIENNRDPIGNGIDGLRANEVVEAIYRSCSEKRPVTLQYNYNY